MSAAVAALLRRSALPLGIVALIALGFTLFSCSIDQAEERGAVQQDQRWQGGQNKANTAAKVGKATTEAGSKAASLRAQERLDDGEKAMRSAYAAHRDQLRNLQGGRSARRAPNQGEPVGAACAPDGAAGRHADQLQAEIDRLRAHLIDVAEEGDRYRLQLLSLQGWITDDLAADAAGRAVEAMALDDSTTPQTKDTPPDGNSRH